MTSLTHTIDILSVSITVPRLRRSGWKIHNERHACIITQPLRHALFYPLLCLEWKKEKLLRGCLFVRNGSFLKRCGGLIVMFEWTGLLCASFTSLIKPLTQAHWSTHSLQSWWNLIKGVQVIDGRGDQGSSRTPRSNTSPKLPPVMTAHGEIDPGLIGFTVSLHFTDFC